MVPTRGIIFSEAMESWLKNLQGHDWKPYFETYKNIPDGVNMATERALADGCSELLYVEEDNVIPDGGLEKMIAANADMAAIDYGCAGWGCITRGKIDGEVKWTGFGCTLVKSYVFDKLAKPYFRDDMQLRLQDMTWVPAPPDRYGGQDIWFGCHLREAGFKIVQIEGECRHLKLEALGRPETNHGAHTIVDKPRITNRNTI